MEASAECVQAQDVESQHIKRFRRRDKVCGSLQLELSSTTQKQEGFSFIVGFSKGSFEYEQQLDLSLRLMVELDLARILVMHGCPWYTYLGTRTLRTRTTSNFSFCKKVAAIDS